MSTRDEYFGRLSFQPTANLLLHGSYRDSEREEDHADVAAFEAATASLGNEATLEIAIFEANWTITNNSYATFRLTDFENLTGSIPDNLLPFAPAADGSLRLDIANLPSQGRLEVPILLAGQTALQPVHHSVHPAVRVPRERRPAGRRLRRRRQLSSTRTTSSARAGRSATTGCSARTSPTTSTSATSGTATRRTSTGTSNGWGNIQIIGGRAGVVTNGQPVFFRASPLQTGITGLPGGTPPPIHSELESQNFEVNDTIRWNDWSFSAGVVVSNDELFGQGLREGGNLPRASSSASPASTRCTRSSGRIRSSRASA